MLSRLPGSASYYVVSVSVLAFAVYHATKSAAEANSSWFALMTNTLVINKVITIHPEGLMNVCINLNLIVHSKPQTSTSWTF